MRLDHVTIRTRDIAGTRAFFESVFDLKERARPKAIQRIPGHWLHADGEPVVHIIGSNGHGLRHPAEAIDHVGYRVFREKLERLGVRYSTMDLAELEERRLFFPAPGGPLLEAVFSEPAPQESDHDLH